MRVGLRYYIGRRTVRAGEMNSLVGKLSRTVHAETERLCGKFPHKLHTTIQEAHLNRVVFAVCRLLGQFDDPYDAS